MPGLLPPRDLAVPLPGSTTARDVLSRAVGRILRELRPTLRAHAASAPDDVATLDRALGTMKEPAALASVLRRPHVGALLRTLRGTLPGTPAARALLVELLGTLAGDLAHLGVLAPVALRAPPPRVVSPLTGPADFRAIDGDGSMLFALADNNPLAMHEAHPDKHGNAVDLGGRPVDEWLASLRAALALLAEHLPDLRAEMDLYVRQVVPVGFFEDRHLSASYREAIGTLYLSLHPSPLTMVEALVHEFQHNKLNALFESDDVLENADAPLFASPVRPDPRPLRGVLLAVHAFVPVAVLYEKLAAAGERGVERRFEDVVRINREGTEVLLPNARPTEVGRGVLEELARWDAHFRGG
ncbi:MAG TPA: HEXXH motif-containing putative peptide modification protein [Polyangiaceae bacterium]